MLTLPNILQGLPYLLLGLVETLKVTALVSIFFPAVGIATYLFRRSNLRLLNVIAYVFIELFRGTPLLGQLFVAFYVFPFVGITLSPLLVGVVVLSLNAGAYSSELIRAGIESVDFGQWEAGRILNLSDNLIFFRIILPQAMRVTLPGLGNMVVELFRTTSALALVTVSELTLRGLSLARITFNPFGIFTMVFLLYFLVSFPSSRFLQLVEQKRTVERE
jgi:polar amino acid transport system permease protein